MEISEQEKKVLAQAEELLHRMGLSGDFPMGKSMDMVTASNFIRNDVLGYYKERSRS